MEDRIVRIVNMPVSIKGLTTKDSNGDYNIYINANISSNEQKIAYDHENDHINKGHFYSALSVEEKEKEI